tara:strand:- start:45510 stop:45836 length:327 start_codon:yes stop_codon:yes gene_type:complete
MKRVVKYLQPTDEISAENVDEGKFYTLETKSNRPFVLVRANATVDGNLDEDQYHWVAIGKVKNRRTGYSSFIDAINGALGKDGNNLKEHDSMADAFEYLQDLSELNGL